MKTHCLHPKSRAVAALAFAVLGFAAGRAQPTAPAADVRASNETPLTLQEFSVTAEKADGYRATTSITATGIGSKIIDTPIAINVITEELIEDVSAFELREALNLVPGVITSTRSESSFNIRGFGGNISYRNGQYRRQLHTTWNVERAEVIKGPSSIFFGAVRPSGVVNFVTTKPMLGETFTDVKLTVGSYDHYRAEVFHNAPLGEKLALRVGLGAVDTKGDRQFEFRDEYYVGASLLWKPTPNQQIVLDLENINRKQFYLNAYAGRAITNSRYIFNGAVPPANQVSQTAEAHTRAWLNANGFASIPTYDSYAAVYGPERGEGYGVALAFDARSNYESKTVDLQYLAKVSDNLVWQTDLNYSLDDAYGLQPATGDTNVYSDGSQRFRVEEFINIRDTINIDNKFTWRFELGGSKHTVQVGQEYQRVVFNRPGYFDSNNRYNNSPFGAYVYNHRPGIDAPVSLRALMNAGGQSFNIAFDRTEINEGYYIVDQVTLFDDRLFLLGGARYNRYSGDIVYTRPVANSSLSPTSPGGLSNFDRLGDEGGWTPQFGALFKVRPGLSAYATYSESIEPNFALDADGNPAEAVESSGWELGLKSSLLNDRLTSTLTYYTINRGNLSYRDTARELATGRSPYYIFGNEEEGDGLEFDINWSVTDNYQVIFGWGHIIEAQQTKSNGVAIDGPRFGYLPDNMYTMWNRYRFSTGPLKGLTLGLGIRRNEEATVSTSSQNSIVVNGFTTADLMIGYNVRIGERDVRLQLNAKNVTDKLYRANSDGYLEDGRRVFFSASTRF
jgi:iron complex outermembrane receptor protein